MSKKVSKAILTKDDIDQLTKDYFRDEAKSANFEEMQAVDSVWDRVKKKQVFKLCAYLYDQADKSRARALKKRNSFTGLTRKTSRQLNYWQGQVDALTKTQAALTDIIGEVKNGEEKKPAGKSA
jgi:hypothetical protein